MSEPIDHGPAMQVKCEEHHWCSTHQPDFPVYWITQCSVCGKYNADRMAEEIMKAGFLHPLSPTHVEPHTLRDDNTPSSWGSPQAASRDRCTICNRTHEPVLYPDLPAQPSRF